MGKPDNKIETGAKKNINKKMEAHGFALQFLERLKEHSQNKEDPISEWILHDNVEERTSNCLCGKEIHVIYFIENKLSHEIIGVGSECVKKWLNPYLVCKSCYCPLGNALQRRREKKFYCRQCRAYIDRQGKCLFWHNYRTYRMEDIVKNIPLLEAILNSDNQKKQLLKNYARHFYEFEEIDI